MLLTNIPIYINVHTHTHAHTHTDPLHRPHWMNVVLSHLLCNDVHNRVNDEEGKSTKEVNTKDHDEGCRWRPEQQRQAVHPRHEGMPKQKHGKGKPREDSSWCEVGVLEC